jgi:hypothetical protein
MAGNGHHRGPAEPPEVEFLSTGKHDINAGDSLVGAEDPWVMVPFQGFEPANMIGMVVRHEDALQLEPVPFQPALHDGCIARVDDQRPAIA